MDNPFCVVPIAILLFISYSVADPLFLSLLHVSPILRSSFVDAFFSNLTFSAYHFFKNVTAYSDHNNDCYKDVSYIYDGLARFEPWAWKWLDACGRPPPGFSAGAVLWPGSYDLCLNNSAVNVHSNKHFAGRYCTVSVSPYENALISIGLCLPNTCNSLEIHRILRTNIPFLNLQPHDIQCHFNQSEIEKDVWFWIALTLCVIILLLTAGGTLTDMLIRYKWIRASQIPHQHLLETVDHVCDAEQNALLSPNDQLDLHEGRQAFASYREEFLRRRLFCTVISAFSLPHNAKSLMQHRKTQSNPDLSFLDGLRLLSLMWIVLGHCVAMPLSVTNNLYLAQVNYFHSWSFQIILSASLAVDVFFFLSALLSSYHSLQRTTSVCSVRSRARFWCQFACHRLLRLTPVYLFVLIFYTGLFFHLYNGPFYPQSTAQTDIGFCRDHWYVLYLNNWIKPNQQCMSWTWYLSDDVQFSFVLAPIFVTLLQRNGKLGLIFLILLGVSSCLTNFFLCQTIRCPLWPASIDYYTQIYVKPYIRWTAYAIGLGFGWLLSLRFTPISLPRGFRMSVMVLCLGLIVSSGFCLSSIFGLYVFGLGQHQTSHLVESIHNSLVRPVFVLGVAIVCWLCVSDRADPIRSLLSWPVFRAMARISYSIYMVHPIVINVLYLGRQTPVHLDNISMLSGFSAVMAISTVIGFVVSMTVEYPVVNLMKYFYLRYVTTS